MAATQPGQQTSFTTIALASAGVVATGCLAYVVYFDYRRRNDIDFRKSLKKQHKKVSKANEIEAKSAEKGQKEKIRRAVDEANEDGFPKDPEETEGYFMQEVARGESMCTDGSDPVDAALCFYKALKVYPQPRELISIYDKTVPKPILDILAEMIAVDPSISVSGAGSSAGSDAGNANVE
ncbi:hypothetical protein KC367_g6499 [Hortaea werneckii]|uniref:Mitochondrial import receptor subunit TOM20 n=2 Tax=Hortaea werneckii TaxID=91943 RepID=A0A3M7I871_HORWE|nr:hypothetical protein KC350_g18514 [Hortaea werneckii]OTA32469.1 hypothetical protein BTJ68_06270 [Hortaea werneckii EXF-2000]KAI6788296.1 hypothetical protein KC358_g18491 [Hortaea werneckii]KAI6822417.1 hypothetical protein KC342_g12626 [Hortaea werneckii]KAI6894799.1 hypothetical protein KC348_g18391 [Hortaea werneckii]